MNTIYIKCTKLTYQTYAYYVQSAHICTFKYLWYCVYKKKYLKDYYVHDLQEM